MVAAWWPALPALLALATLASLRLAVAPSAPLRLGWRLAGSVLVLVAIAAAWSAAQGAVGLLGTRHGHAALLVLGLMTACAWLAPAPVAAARILRGALALLSLALLPLLWRHAAADPQGMWWPLSWRYDPDLPVGTVTWRALARALGLSALAAVALALAWRAWRGSRSAAGPRTLAWAAAALACALAAPWPQPRAYLVEATPASYRVSALPLDAANLAEGARAYQAQCAACHGVRADGQGPLAAAQVRWPSALGPGLYANQPIGDLYWKLRHGAGAHAGLALDDDTAWRILDYLRTRAWGLAGGRDLAPLRAPALALRCGGQPRSWESLAGLPVRVIAHGAESVAERYDPRVTTVVLTQDAALDADCVATGSDAWRAYAWVAGVAPAELAGAQFLVDRAGWLRARQTGAGGGWTSADAVCGPAGRSGDTSAAGLGGLLAAMDEAPIVGAPGQSWRVSARSSMPR